MDLLNATTPPSFQENAYGYDPNKWLALGASFAWGLVQVVILAETIFLKRKRWFMLTVVVGTIAEAIGYGIRFMSARHPEKINAAVGGILFILLAPIILALGAYLTVAHIVKQLRDKAGLMNPKVFEIAFICADVVSFLIQAAGGGLLVKGNSSQQKIAKGILIFGLAISLISFSIFLVFTIVVQLRTRRIASGQRWQLLFVVVYINAGCLIVRSIYRLIEFAAGRHSWIATHEVCFYTLDTIPMFTAALAWAFLHPSFFKVKASAASDSK